jgi:hypothetical protein
MLIWESQNMNLGPCSLLWQNALFQYVTISSIYMWVETGELCFTFPVVLTVVCIVQLGICTLVWLIVICIRLQYFWDIISFSNTILVNKVLLILLASQGLSNKDAISNN